MTEELKKFILNNAELINEDTKESWKQIYRKIAAYQTGKLTEVLLEAEIDPVAVLKYVPSCYLAQSNITEYEIPDGCIRITKSAFCGNFSFQHKLKRIRIPSSVEVIEENAFYECETLEQVIFENNSKLHSIGESAFSFCRQLSNINLPDSIQHIGQNIFLGCNSLKLGQLENKIKYWGTPSKPYLTASKCLDKNITEADILAGCALIDYKAFSGCNKLKKVNIPNTIIKISEYAFEDCVALKGIMIPNSVKEIDSMAFEGCKSLTDLVIPDSVTDMGVCVFQNCESLAHVQLSNNVTCIKSSIFRGCSSLQRVELPKGVTDIGSEVFYDCSNLKDIIIPNTVINIGDNVFSYCDLLTSITFNGTKKEAIKLGIGNKSKKKWRQGSAIQKIICTDGEINLQ